MTTSRTRCSSSPSASSTRKRRRRSSATDRRGEVVHGGEQLLLGQVASDAEQNEGVALAEPWAHRVSAKSGRVRRHLLRGRAREIDDARRALPSCARPGNSDLVRPGRDRHPSVEHRVEEARVALLVGRASRCRSRSGGSGAEEQADERARRPGTATGRPASLITSREPRRRAAPRVRRASCTTPSSSRSSTARPAAVASGFPDERARLVHGAERREHAPSRRARPPKARRRAARRR